MNKELLQKEFSYRMSRSGGKGGQHVNKVATKVEVVFDLVNSAVFSDEQKERIIGKLNRRINAKGEIQVVCQSTRSQLKNKNFAVAKLFEMLENALIEKAKRKPTRIPKAVKEKRLQAKRMTKEKKSWRGKIDY